jgi:hypothetical protein
MKKRISSMSVILAVAVSVFFLSYVVSAQQIPPKIDPKKLEPKITPPVLKADLEIAYIEAYNCLCEDNLNNVDAMYVSSIIKVGITNKGPNKTDGKLVVTYYDMKLNKYVHITRTFTNLAPSGGKSFTISNTPKLIQKSKGIRADVTVTSALTKDPDMSNNQKKIIGCFMLGPI